MGAWAALVSLVLGLITAISQSTSCARLIQICCAILKLGARSGCYAPVRNEAAFSFSSGEPEGHGCWYVKVSETVTSAAILKLLIGPDSSTYHPKIIRAFNKNMRSKS